MPATIDLTSLPIITNDVYWPLYGCATRNLVLMGGAGSGKSVFASQKIAVRIMSEQGHYQIGFRKVAETVKKSIFAEFQSSLKMLGVYDLWKVNLTERTFTFLPNGGVFACMGLDDQEKLKSIARMTGAWMEEATEFVPADYEQINLRLRGQTPGYKQIILSFNPISAMHWLKKHFFDADQNGRTTRLVTTYRDNRFVDLDYIHELEELKRRDPIYGAIYVDAQWGELKGSIYAPFSMGPWPASFDETIYGIDFGFNNPMVLLRGDLRDRVPYITELFYRSGYTTADLIAFMKGPDVKSPLVPWTARIYADSAEPDRIEEIRRAGWRHIVAVPKPPGSVKAGITFCKSLNIHTREGNTNFNAENATYRWRLDNNQNPMDEPEKLNDHAMDAMRYMLHTHLTKSEGGKVTPGAFEGAGLY